MATRYDQPIIRVAYLNKLIAGSVTCEHSGWFRSQFYGFEKHPKPIPFDFAGWKIEHEELLDTVYPELKKRFPRISRDANRNQFDLIGTQSRAILRVQPHLIGASATEVVIADVRTGKPQEEHVIQILIYMWALPKIEKLKSFFDGRKMSGEIHYKSGVIVTVDWERDGTQGFQERLVYLLQAFGKVDQPCEKTPAKFDCNDCPIAACDCSDRLDGIDEQMSFADF